jgi:hypothetical protein
MQTINDLKAKGCKLSDDQITHGLNKIQAAATACCTDPATFATILVNQRAIREFFEWVNAGQFLEDYDMPMPKPEPKKRNTYPVPAGWVLVTDGVSLRGDKYWQDGWVTVAVTAGDPVGSYAGPVIRNPLEHFELRPSGLYPRSPRQG